jgi:hypothetical protein
MNMSPKQLIAVTRLMGKFNIRDIDIPDSSFDPIILSCVPSTGDERIEIDVYGDGRHSAWRESGKEIDMSKLHKYVLPA